MKVVLETEFEPGDIFQHVTNPRKSFVVAGYRIQDINSSGNVIKYKVIGCNHKGKKGFYPKAIRKIENPMEETDEVIPLKNNVGKNNNGQANRPD